MTSKTNFNSSVFLRNSSASGMAVIEYIIIILAVSAISFVILAWFGGELRTGVDAACDATLEVIDKPENKVRPLPNNARSKVDQAVKDASSAVMDKEDAAPIKETANQQ